MYEKLQGFPVLTETLCWNHSFCSLLL